MMTEDEYVARWLNYTAGAMALGSATFRQSLKVAFDPAANATDRENFGGVIFNLGDGAGQMLRLQYRSLVASMQPAAKVEPSKSIQTPAAVQQPKNGQPAQQPATPARK